LTGRLPPQSRAGSFGEALANVLTGFLIAVAVQRLAYPLFGISTSLTQDGLIAAIFTAASLVRAYALRRLFVWIGACRRHGKQQRLASLERRLATGRLHRGSGQ
jgi:predicted lysophospholipase L1 biosynthesis ABC-type transport system permease subunit